MTRALFLAPYPPQAASTRFRATQYFAYLEAHGVSCELAALVSPRQFASFYAGTDRLGQLVRLAGSTVGQTLRALSSRRFDVVVVQRGALLFGPPVLEWLVATVNRTPIVFDFDDAIWLQERSSSWGYIGQLAKFPSKVAQIIRIARHVIVCNQYTRDYALRFRSVDAITVIPTVVDADVFTPVTDRSSSLPTVGWIGTHSTANYLEDIIGPIREVAATRRFVLKIVGSGRRWDVPGPDVVVKPWSLAEEVSDYQSLDVGLYPVRNDAWGQGKSGFKPVVYMSCGVPCIASPVGGVTEFLQDGVNGLLAPSPADWQEDLARLLDDVQLRRRLGAAARQTVLDEYCLRVQAPRLRSVLLTASAA